MCDLPTSLVGFTIFLRISIGADKFGKWLAYVSLVTVSLEIEVTTSGLIFLPKLSCVIRIISFNLTSKPYLDHNLKDIELWPTVIPVTKMQDSV